MNKNSKAMLITACVLGLIYLLLLPPANHGYGYMGYYGYHHGPSWWYWGSPTVYHERSVRLSSTGGPHSLGGGPGVGK